MARVSEGSPNLFQGTRTRHEVPGESATESNHEEFESRYFPRGRILFGVECVQESGQDEIVWPNHGGGFNLHVGKGISGHPMTNTRFGDQHTRRVVEKPAIPKPKS